MSASLTGIQSKFDWGAVALSAIESGVSAGVGKLIPGVGPGSAFLRGVLSSAATQGIAVATGLQKKFDWAGVAAAGVSGGVSAAAGGAGLGNIAANFVGGIAAAATRSLITGTDFGDNILAVLPGVIGQTIGNAVAESASTYDAPAGGYDEGDLKVEQSGAETADFETLKGAPALTTLVDPHLEDIVNSLPQPYFESDDNSLRATTNELIQLGSKSNAFNSNLVYQTVEGEPDNLPSNVSDLLPFGPNGRPSPSNMRDFMDAARALSVEGKIEDQATAEWVKDKIGWIGTVGLSAEGTFTLPGGLGTATASITIAWDRHGNSSLQATIEGGSVIDSATIRTLSQNWQSAASDVASSGPISPKDFWTRFVNNVKSFKGISWSAVGSVSFSSGDTVEALNGPFVYDTTQGGLGWGGGYTSFSGEYHGAPVTGVTISAGRVVGASQAHQYGYTWTLWRF